MIISQAPFSVILLFLGLCFLRFLFLGFRLLFEGGLAVGASLEDLGKGLRSQVGTMFGTLSKGTRYLEMAEGYCTRMGLDADGEVVGYEFVHMGKVMDMVKQGMDANGAHEKAKGTYGRFAEAVKYIDPRKE